MPWIGSLDSALRVECWLLPASSEGHSGAGDESVGSDYEGRLTHPRLFSDDKAAPMWIVLHCRKKVICDTWKTRSRGMSLDHLS